MILNNNLKLDISTSAIKRLKEILKSKPEKTFLRLEIISGGCSGFNTKFILDDKINGDDITFTKEDITYVTDSTSLALLEDKTPSIEYKSSLIGAFFWLDLKKSTSRCSCGSSFSI